MSESVGGGAEELEWGEKNGEDDLAELVYFFGLEGSVSIGIGHSSVGFSLPEVVHVSVQDEEDVVFFWKDAQLSLIGSLMKEEVRAEERE